MFLWSIFFKLRSETRSKWVDVSFPFCRGTHVTCLMYAVLVCVCSHVLRWHSTTSAPQRVHHSTRPASRLSHGSTWSSLLGRRLGGLPPRRGDVQRSGGDERRPGVGAPHRRGVACRRVIGRRPSLARGQRGPAAVQRPADAGRRVPVSGDVVRRLRRVERRRRGAAGWCAVPGAAGDDARAGLVDVVSWLSAFGDVQRRRCSCGRASRRSRYCITVNHCHLEQVRPCYNRVRPYDNSK